MEATKTKKNIIAAALACVLMVVLAVGGTLAYLWDVTEAKTNSFTFVSGNVSIEIDEGNWDAEDAKNLVPSATIVKEPSIINTTTAEDTSVYVAMRVVFTDGEGNTLSDAQFEKLSTLITIDWIDWSGNSRWVTETGYRVETANAGGIGSGADTIYYYDVALSNKSGSNQTATLFNSVTINSSATSEDLTWLADATYADTEGTYAGVYGLGGFNIVIYGAAIQTSGFDGNITITTGVSAAEAVLAWEELEDLFE